MSYSRKKQGGRTRISRGIEERTWKFQGSIKKEVEFLGVFKKNSCGISMGPHFLLSNFQGVSHNFVEFLGVKVCFLQNF